MSERRCPGKREAGGGQEKQRRKRQGVEWGEQEAPGAPCVPGLLSDFTQTLSQQS